MDHEYGQCSDPNSNPYPYHYSYPNDDTEVLQLASSCPKKKAGRKKFKETRHPVYRGVRQRNGNRWVCEVRSPTDQTRIWLGTYPIAEMAARAHDVAALALRGRNACLNFADSAWCLPVPATSNTQDIQRAAAEAAELFRPQEDDQHPEEQGHGGGGDGTMKSSDQQYDQAVASSSGGYGEGSYVDEEAVFDMPGLLTNMAEGLLLPPPNASHYYGGGSGGGFTNWDESESDYGDVPLWSY